MWFCCQRHTGMPPVSRCFQIPAAPLSVKGSGCSRESGGRFVLRRRRRCPVGLLPACASPQGEQSLLRPELHLTCSSVGLAPTRAAFAGRARIFASGQGRRAHGHCAVAEGFHPHTHFTLTGTSHPLHSRCLCAHRQPGVGRPRVPHVPFYTSSCNLAFGIAGLLQR